MSDDIDWSKAPEGATHCNPARIYPWLRDGSPVAYFAGNRGWRGYSDADSARNAISGAVPRPAPQPEAHADDLAVDTFARAMGARLATCRAAGRSGWDDPEQCPPQRLAEGLVRAIRAGKLVDVGNYAMMLWKRADQAQAMARVPGWIGEALQPEPVEWDGTGLPPVGMLVQAQFKGVGWTEVMVVAHHLGCAVVWTHSAYCAMQPGWLRPILTPEQHAAKERDEAVAAMLEFAEEFSHGQVPFKPFFEALHDAGWRKKETE